MNNLLRIYVKCDNCGRRTPWMIARNTIKCVDWFVLLWLEPLIGTLLACNKCHAKNLLARK